MEHIDEKVQRTCADLSFLLSVAVAVIGAISYMGISFDLHMCNHPDPMQNVAPLTALSLVVLGLTAAFYNRCSIFDRTEQEVIVGLAGFISIIALVVLSKHFLHYPLDLESIVWGVDLPPINEPCPFRMNKLSAICLFLSSLAFGFLTSENDRKIKIGQGLLVIPLLFSCWVCFSYLMQSGAATSVSAGPLYMPLRSGFILLLLSCSLLLMRADRGFLWVICSNAAGGILIRPSLPLALFGPVLLGLICWWGEQAGFYSSNASLAVIATSASAFFICVLLASFGIARHLDEKTKRMVVKVERANAEYQEKLSKLASVNEELQELSKQAQSAQSQAFAISRMKSEFVSKMSQEIRMPMNSVLSIVEAMLRLPLNATVREYVLVMRDAGRAFLVIINDILDFSSIEEGSLVIENGPVDIVQLVDSVGKLLAPQAHKKSLLFLTYIDPEIPDTIIGDEVRLRQIILNLAGNALKFTEKGKVVIRADLINQNKKEVTVKFSVQDTGIGISDEERRRLFQPFVQADGTISRKYGGTGLGLSISKKLTELMGGEIGAESSKGEGSTFWFSCTFPSRRKRRLSESITFDGTRAVLYCDDDDSREVLGSYLEYFGCNVISPNDAATMDEAIGALSASSTSERQMLPDVVFIDQSFVERDEIPDNINKLDVSTVFILLTDYGSEDNPESKSKLKLPGKKKFSWKLKRPFSRTALFSCLERSAGGPHLDSVFETVDQDESFTGPTRTSLRMQTLSGIHKTQRLALENEGLLEDQIGLALVVDDSSINRHVAVVLLEGLGMKCHTAVNGLQAIREYNARPYDIIIMDCQMPEMDGYNATKQIRRLEKRTGKHVPIVALTANVIEGSRETCLAAGMDDFMSKPVNADILEQMLHKWVPALCSGNRDRGMEEISAEISLETQKIQEENDSEQGSSGGPGQ